MVQEERESGWRERGEARFRSKKLCFPPRGADHLSHDARAEVFAIVTRKVLFGRWQRTLTHDLPNEDPKHTFVPRKDYLVRTTNTNDRCTAWRGYLTEHGHNNRQVCTSPTSQWLQHMRRRLIDTRTKHISINVRLAARPTPPTRGSPRGQGRALHLPSPPPPTRRLHL